MTAGVGYAFYRFIWQLPGPTLSRDYKGVQYELLSPRMLAVGLLLPFFLLVMGKSLADLPWPQRIFSVLLRFSFVLLIGVSLARLSRTSETSKVCTVFVLDVSESVPIEALGDAKTEVQDAIDARPKDDLVKVITFARSPRVLDLLEDGKKAPEVTRHDAPGTPIRLGAGSNIQAAMQLAYGLFQPGYLKRVVLMTDGLQTHGDVLAEASRAKEIGAKVSVIPYKRPVPGEVALRELKMPAKVKVGEAFEIHGDVYASRATKAKAKLFQGEVLNGLEGVRTLDLVAGANDVVFKSIVRVAGEVTYSLELDDIADDKFKEKQQGRHDDRRAGPTDGALHRGHAAARVVPFERARGAAIRCRRAPAVGLPRLAERARAIRLCDLERHAGRAVRGRSARACRALRQRPWRRVSLRGWRGRIQPRRVDALADGEDPAGANGR